ncbi:aminotransferase class IV [Microbulbifer bruguierae]|uniref:Aminotransferase class IV n=1 Tax=Microbulbifer bruguierae TaxID=3029061 RepID=A0ABY8NDP0_9GAMM|nr:aminotransferase class IV [Microbulbifer bruguierae]WGL17018.1 aminotransferase class IV [Microbulbifer bruguierae]
MLYRDDAAGFAGGLPEDRDFSSGLLETMRAHRGQIPLLSLHLARLYRCGVLQATVLDDIARAAQDLAGRTEGWPGGARIRLRYGWFHGGQMGDVSPRLRWDLTAVALEVATAWDNGVALYVCETPLEPLATVSPFLLSKTRNGAAQEPVRGCKLLCRDNYRAAAAELSQFGASTSPADIQAEGAVAEREGLIRDPQGRVIEGLRTNLLIRRGGAWWTPDLTYFGVRGVMREWLAGRVEIIEDDIVLANLEQADALAVCNSVRGVVPVIKLFAGDRVLFDSRRHVDPALVELQELVHRVLWQ